MKDDRITVRLCAELSGRLRRAGRSAGTPVAGLVREALEQQSATGSGEVSAFEHAKRTGLIGAVRGASRDLSTNPKHLDGFGGS
jgi:hypothetical protein